MASHRASRVRTRRSLRRLAPTHPLAIAGGVVFAVAACASVLAWGTTPHVAARTPEIGTRADRVQIALDVRRAGALRADDISVAIDGRRVDGDVTVSDGELAVTLGRLEEGRHTVSVRSAPVGLLRRRIDERWSFVVDRTAPAVRVASPEGDEPRSDERSTRFQLSTEPHSTVTFTAGSKVAHSGSGERGIAAARLELREGINVVGISVRDQVGNVTERRMRVRVDSLPPVAGLVLPKVLDTTALSVTATANDASAVDVTATLDGTDEGIDVSRSGKLRYLISSEQRLAEGRHRIEFTATDDFGHETVVRRNLIVDSSEQLGENALMVGARGADVRQLHDELRRLKLFLPRERPAELREYRRRQYGRETAAAVRRFQSSKGLSADGVAGSETIAVMTLKIVIDRAAHTLTLLRSGEAIRTYPVAVGSSEYPTPPGDFSIQNMQKHPTWTPPDSDWAKDAKVTPPGPDNPLGTRWMAINGTVGIHGTNNPASLGYSVSHGCIRMAISDVEELFDMVAVGTPVTVI